jgi:hypothetical protein
MHNVMHTPLDIGQSADLNTINAVLEGGPADFPDELRLTQTHPADTRIKIVHRGGYEHFEIAGPVVDAGNDTLLFTWTARTRIAE